MAEKCEMKLLGTPASPFVNRVQFALNLKSIDYDFIHENLACKSDLLLKSNPVHKKVPVLFHLNKPPICESLIIIEYLDEIRPDSRRILSSVPSDRANDRFWADYIDNQFYPLFEEVRRTPDKKGALKKQIAEGLEVLEVAFSNCSNGKAYFGGDEIRYLDIVFGCFFGWMEYFETVNNFKFFDETKTHGLAEWAKRMRSHEAIRDAIPNQDIVMKFHMMLHVVKPPRTA